MCATRQSYCLYNQSSVVPGPTACGAGFHRVWCRVSQRVVSGPTVWCRVSQRVVLGPPRVELGRTACGVGSHHVWRWVPPRVVLGPTACGVGSHSVWCRVPPCGAGSTACGAGSHRVWCRVSLRVVSGLTTCGAGSHSVCCRVPPRVVPGPTARCYNCQYTRELTLIVSTSHPVQHLLSRCSASPFLGWASQIDTTALLTPNQEHSSRVSKRLGHWRSHDQ
jgi:hypothetical protein